LRTVPMLLCVVLAFLVYIYTGTLHTVIEALFYRPLNDNRQVGIHIQLLVQSVGIITHATLSSFTVL
jgi:uncharacterized membrane protein